MKNTIDNGKKISNLSTMEDENYINHNEQLIKAFITEKELNDGFTSKSLKKYEGEIRRCLQLNRKRAENIMATDVLKWLKEYHSENKPSTINTSLTILTSFFQYLRDEEIISVLPIKSKWRQKIPKTIPQSLKNDEIARLMIYAETLNLRDRTIIELLRSSGMRRSELCSINLEDIDFKGNSISIIGKGKKERIVHFSEEAHMLLKKLTADSTSNNEPVFKNKFGNRISRYSVWVATTKAGKAIGLQRSLNPHRLRHNFATSLAIKGARIEFIAEELGHDNLYTTQIYTHVPSREIKSIYRKLVG